MNITEHFEQASSIFERKQHYLNVWESFQLTALRKGLRKCVALCKNIWKIINTVASIWLESGFGKLFAFWNNKCPQTNLGYCLWMSIIFYFKNCRNNILIHFIHFVVDLIPMLSERAGLPPGTPITMFEVRTHAVNSYLYMPWFNFFPKIVFGSNLIMYCVFWYVGSKNDLRGANQGPKCLLWKGMSLRDIYHCMFFSLAHCFE